MLRYVTGRCPAGLNCWAGQILDIATDDSITADRVAAEYGHARKWRDLSVRDYWRDHRCHPSANVVAVDEETVGIFLTVRENRQRGSN